MVENFQSCDFISLDTCNSDGDYFLCITLLGSCIKMLFLLLLLLSGVGPFKFQNDIQTCGYKTCRWCGKWLEEQSQNWCHTLLSLCNTSISGQDGYFSGIQSMLILTPLKT